MQELPTKDTIADGVLAGRKVVGLTKAERYRLRCAIVDLMDQGHALNSILAICETTREFYFCQIDTIREPPEEKGQKASNAESGKQPESKKRMTYEEQLALIDKVENLRYTCNLFIDDACRRAGTTLRKYYQLSMRRSAIIAAIRRGLGKTEAEPKTRKRRMRIPDATDHDYRCEYVRTTRGRLAEGSHLRHLLRRDRVPYRTYFKWANESDRVFFPDQKVAENGGGAVLQLWRTFGQDKRNMAARNALSDHYMPLVSTIAEKLSYTLPRCVQLDDLKQAGVFGLFDALDGFDPHKGARFRTYATTRIWGSMMDFLRDEDWVPRLERAKFKHARDDADRFFVEHGHRPHGTEPGGEGGDLSDGHEESSHAIPGMFSLYDDAHQGMNDDGPLTWADVTADGHGSDPESSLRKMDVLRLALRGCNRNERLILLLYYYEGMTMKEIGEYLDLSESRISQMHTVIVERQNAQWGGQKDVV